MTCMLMARRLGDRCNSGTSGEAAEFNQHPKECFNGGVDRKETSLLLFETIIN